MDARRDSYESAMFSLQNLDDVQEYSSIVAGNFGLEETILAVAEVAEFSWAQLISRREREVFNE